MQTPEFAEPPSSSARVTVRSAPELVGAIPGLLGFRPERSVVVVTMRDGVVDVTARVDSTEISRDPAGGQDMVDALTRGNVDACVMAIFGDERPEDRVLPERGLANHVGEMLADRGLEVWDRLFVYHDRVWSYDCAEPCCPLEGRPVAVADPGGPLDVRGVRQTRSDLEREMDPVDDDRTAAIAREVYRLDVGIGDRGGLPSTALRAVRSAVESADELSVVDAGALIVAMRDVRVRDAVLAWVAGNEAAIPAGERVGGPAGGDDVGTDGSEALDNTHRQLRRVNTFFLWLDMFRRAPRDAFPDVACVLAAHVWSGGDGARARIALERAHLEAPGHRLTDLMLQSLDRGLAPSDLRTMLRGEELARGVREADAEELVARHRQAKGA